MYRCTLQNYPYPSYIAHKKLVFNSLKTYENVGMTGFEPATSRSQSAHTANCTTSRLYSEWDSNPHEHYCSAELKSAADTNFAI